MGLAISPSQEDVVETEAKLSIPNRRVYRGLLRLRSLAGYTLMSAGVSNAHDRYFDTADGRLWAGGYACRLRTVNDGLLLTLKGLGGVEGAVHRRPEHEVELPAWNSDPAAWPDGAARCVALELAGGAPIALLLELRQRRVLSDVMDGERRVGQLSLDAVRTEAGGRPVSSYELELELAPSGTEADLARVVEELIRTWDLAPEPRSKFERALELLRRSGVDSQRLTPNERAGMQAISQSPDVLVARRASALLAWDQGLPTREIVARTGMSDGRVRYWVRAFRADRMGIFHGEDADFPSGPLPQNPSDEPVGESDGAALTIGPTAMASVATPHAATRQGTPQRASKAAGGADRRNAGRRNLPSAAEFCEQHGVDIAHARFVELQALFLFDALRPIHKLPKKRRALLRWAALLNTVGAAQDPERPNRAGRDLILAQPLHNLNTADRLAVACVVAFGRGKVRPEREPTMAALEGKVRAQIGPLSAILRIAEALDFSRTQSSAILALTEITGEQCEVVVQGPVAEMDALQAADCADMWDRLFGQQLLFLAAQPAGGAADRGQPPTAEQPQEAAPAAAVQVPPVEPDDPMPEAGRKVLYLHFVRMLANEAGTRLGEDPEALHDMRVATRRMRAAFDLFAPYYERKVLAPFAKGLRRTGRTLGAVRDLDVLLGKAAAYQAGLPPESTDALEPLLVHWQTRREVARRQMLEFLDGPAYRRFTAEFELFLVSPGAGAIAPSPDEIKPYQVRHLVPRLVTSRYEAVRAYEVVLPGAPLTTYHMLRIECKRLRYALEFFRDVLGEGAPALIKEVVGMQDLLGELQDAHVAELLLQEFLNEHRRKHKKQDPAPRLEGVELYLEAQRAIQAELVGRFPAPWTSLTGLDFRRALGMALAAL
jgi:CHAD domain-containing protein